MNKKILYTLIAVISIGLLVSLYLLNNKKSVNNAQTFFTVNTFSVVPHIITKEDYNGSELKPEIKKIQSEILSLLLVKHPDNKEYYNNLSLRGISKDFAVITVNRPTGAGPIDELVNLKTGESIVLGDFNSSISLTNGFIYIESTSIHYYSLGSKSSTVVEGSILLKNNETYNSGGDMKVTPEETHTDSSISINVFDSSSISQGAGTADYKFKKLRTETFSFPK